jgi:hypothetical protein
MLHVTPPLQGDISDNASLEHSADPGVDLERNKKGSAATLSILDDSIVGTESVHSMDERLVSTARLFKTRKRAASTG